MAQRATVNPTNMSHEPIQDIPPVQVEDILYLVQEMAARHEERDPADIGFETAVCILADRHPDDFEKVHAIMARMRCLPPLMNDPRMRGWTMEGIQPDCVLTSEAVFRAAAQCPLRSDENADRRWFDPDEFFSIALSETPPEGTA